MPAGPLLTNEAEVLESILERVRKAIHEMEKDFLCEQCGKNRKMYARGRFMKLCASCGLKNLLFFLYHWRHRLPTDIYEYRRARYIHKRHWRLTHG